ncbi:hypothetical protein DESC_610364 [Desulfosarcina cetonica]|nr:hypothetical protein DESC_610364 [Desulfosarcina cetonica]
MTHECTHDVCHLLVQIHARALENRSLVRRDVNRALSPWNNDTLTKCFIPQIRENAREQSSVRPEKPVPIAESDLYPVSVTPWAETIWDSAFRGIPGRSSG